MPWRFFATEYVKNDPEREASVEHERINAEVARLIYTMRTDGGLTQEPLADLVGTTQSVISRLEDSDYDGHSLSMLTGSPRPCRKTDHAMTG